MVKSGGEAFYENIPSIKKFKDKKHTTLTSEYKKGYLMHGPIGPSAACAVFTNKRFTIYSHSQALYDLKLSCSQYFKIDPNNITLKFRPGSGCYGHNGADDVAFEAAVLSKEFPDIHILLKWTREDEHCWEPYGSASLNKLTGVIDNEGKIVYWSNEAFSDTYMTRPSNTELHNFISYNFINNNFIKHKSTPKTKAHMGIHRNLDPLYDFGENRLVKNLVHNLPLRTSALRTLGAFSNVIALECFLNELAKTKNIDPFEIRINHLRDERAINVIKNIKTSVIDKEGMPYLGVGEVVAGPTGAAISNAISEALGQTIKTMPFTKEIITRELLEN